MLMPQETKTKEFQSYEAQPQLWAEALCNLFVCVCSNEIEFGSIVSGCECLLPAPQNCIEDKAIKLTQQSPAHLKNTQSNEAQSS